MRDFGTKGKRWTGNWVEQLGKFEDLGLIPKVKLLSNGSVYFQLDEPTQDRMPRRRLAQLLLSGGFIIVGFIAALLASALPQQSVPQLAAGPSATINEPDNCSFDENSLDQFFEEHGEFVIEQQIVLGSVRQIVLFGECANQDYRVRLIVAGANDKARIEKVAYSIE